MKKVLSVLIALFVVSIMGLQIVDAEQSGDVFVLKNIEGEILKQGKDLQKNNNILLNELKVNQEDGIIKGEGSITRNGIETHLVLDGVLYPVNGRGYYAGNLVLGDIKATKDYNVLQFRIENKVNDAALEQYHGESAIFSIVLEDKKTGEWLRFQEVIDHQVFEIFYQGSNVAMAKMNMNEDEVAKKIIPLLNMHNKAEHGDQIPKSVQIIENGKADTDGHITVDTPITTQSWAEIPVNFNELNRLLEDLKDPYTNRVNLSDYSLPESLFKGSGWKKYVSVVTSPGWNYYAYSVGQTTNTITQITVFQHDSEFKGWRKNENGYNNDFDIALSYIHGMILEYDHYSKELRVMYYDLGLTLQDLQIVQGGLEDRNIYIAQTMYGRNLTRSSGNLISYFISLIPYGDKVVDLWETLTHSKNEELGQRERFIGSTYEEQIQMHNGKVYRSVSGNLNQWNLSKEESHTNLLGEIHSGDGYISLRWSFKTTVATNL